MGRSILTLTLCLLAAATAWAAPAAQQQFSVDTVSGEVVEVLGASAGRGWTPLRVSMRNRDTAEPRTVSFELEANYADLMARSAQERRVKLAPGESRTIEIQVPCDRQPGATSSMYLNVRVNGQGDYISLDAASVVRPGAGRTIALVSAEGLPETDVSLARKALEDAGKGTSNTLRGTGEIEVEPIPTTRYFSGHGAAEGAMLVSMTAKNLPERALGWSGVDTIVCDTRGTFPRDPRWEVLAEWVRAGGQVAFVGPDAAGTASRLPGIRNLVDKRMELSLASTPTDGVTVYRAGLGLISLNESSAGAPAVFAAQGWAWILKALDESLPDGMDEGTRPRSPSLIGAIYDDSDPWTVPPERKPLPVRLVLFFLFLFAFVAGPIAVWWTRSKGRPDLLFLSVPALSIAATLILLAYGIGREGFAVKGNAHSMAILDQREDGLCTTVLRRELFVGRGGYALEPKPGTVVMVHDPGLDDRRRVVQDDGASMRLGGAFLPVREQTSHIVVRTAPSRVRLEVEPAGSGYRVTNGLGVDIEALGLRTPDGTTFRAEGPIRSGESMAIGPGELPWADGRLKRIGDPMFAAADVPKAGYIAMVASSPTADDCGVPMDEIDSKHVVVGYLPLEGKEWGQ